MSPSHTACHPESTLVRPISSLVNSAPNWSIHILADDARVRHPKINVFSICALSPFTRAQHHVSGVLVMQMRSLQQRAAYNCICVRCTACNGVQIGIVLPQKNGVSCVNNYLGVMSRTGKALTRVIGGTELNANAGTFFYSRNTELKHRAQQIFCLWFYLYVYFHILYS